MSESPLLNKKKTSPAGTYSGNTNGKGPAGAREAHRKPNYEGGPVPIFLAGTGAVGGTIIEELENGYSLKIVGACNTRHCVLDHKGIPPGELAGRLEEGAKTDWNLILDFFEDRPAGNLIFVDATGSEQVARLYPSILESDIHIATPSKRANTLEQSFYDRLQELCTGRGLEFRYETTVGAALPVISTLNDLQQSGDTITEISGVVSGTMTYIFNELENETPFSSAVQQARELGYAEPDPRDDLSGEDVARKFLTLARSIGLKIERSDLDVETLVPDKLISVDRNTFLSELAGYDDLWRSRIEDARKQNRTLRYVGKLTHHDSNISVGIQSIPADSPLGQLRGTDNLFQISTRRYSDTPIVIQGPGAGKEVTAAGVLADVLKIARKNTRVGTLTV